MVQGGLSSSKAIKGTECLGAEVAHLRFCLHPGISLDENHSAFVCEAKAVEGSVAEMPSAYPQLE